MKLWRTIKNLLSPPVVCIVCEDELKENVPLSVCEDCWQKLQFNRGHICAYCGRAVDNLAQYCLNCREDFHRSYRLCRSAFRYEGDAGRMIRALKFRGAKYLAEFFAVEMANVYRRENLEAECIVFVPMTWWKKLERGYNQAELLAKKLAQELNLPVCDAVKKLKRTESQVELSAKARHANLSGVFRADKTQVAGKCVLLVDDVLTTGTTANAVAEVLRIAGAAEVCVLTACSTPEKIEKINPSA